MYNVPFLFPDVTNACMFAQFLANKHAAPNTIKNYISGARTWIDEHQGNTCAFNSARFSQLVKGLVKNSDHVPVQATPLTNRHIGVICRFLDSSDTIPLAVKPALLIGYSCFLRASNLFTTTMLAGAGPHTLLAGDIRSELDGLTIIIRSTKTRSTAKPIAFKIPREENSLLCPLQAWSRYSRSVQPWPLGPAFLHPNHLPLTGRQVVSFMHLALQREPDIDTRRVSLHSLRRGATQTSVDLGIPLDTIKTRGTWASDSGIRPYLPSHPRKVPTVPVINLAL